MADAAIVHDWLLLLAGFNGYGLSKDEVNLRLSLLAPALAEEYPVEAFTRDTLRAVAKKHLRYFPGFGEICEILEPVAQAAREDRRLRIEYSGPSRVESQEPYQLPPAPDWCFERKPRLMGAPTREEIASIARPPIRTPAEQYAAIMGCALAEAEARLASSPRATADA